MISGQTPIELLYDSRYHEAGRILELLSAALLTGAFGLAPLCFVALGAPQFLSHIVRCRAATLFVALPAGFFYFGLAGATLGVVASHFAGLIPTIFYASKYGLFDLRKEICLLPAVLAGMITAIVFNLILGFR